ncbi:GxxExxY protein [Ferruginibacter sp. HRS2-29]|uniref:GxxExxY protein n=1 Tax=Ferruginibacter sp. HRS2-29 TaxID=2487334 RepID=UPI0020CC9884|nr:GxxExxY protein [Ferruginibacter sp. HRS2-29]MCP9751741.1 GxxExxY protein [Ferruginibacter sp. HRS2-29]
MASILYPEESFKIIGICMSIHRYLGMGLKEINYKDAMEIEFVENGFIYEREKRFAVKYKNVELKNPYVADFILNDLIVLEIKSVPVLIDAHKAQTLSYLAVTGLKLGLLINFGERSLTWQRVIL